MINDLVKKLRKAADALDDLFVSVKNEGKAKRAIHKSMDKTFALKQPEVKKKSLAGYKYKPGTHWTQRPENKDRVRKIARKMGRAKRVKKA